MLRFAHENLLQRGKCACCHASIKRGYHVDHIQPLARGGEIHIKRLAGLGRYVSSDMSNHIGAEHEKMAEAIEAAEAQEGGAA